MPPVRLTKDDDEPLVPEITDYNYIGSAIGNAFFSGVTFEQLWNCVSMSNTPEELDAAVTATIEFNKMFSELINGARSGSIPPANKST